MNVSTCTEPYSQTRPRSLRPEVDEHHVLGALLLVGQQLGGDARVLVRVGAARARAGDRARRDVRAGDGQQRLGRGARRSGSRRSRGSTCTGDGLTTRSPR